MRTKPMLLSVVAALAVTASAVSPAEEPFDINVIVPLTGAAAFPGKGTQAGLQAVEQLVNRTGGIAGRPVHFVFADDQSNPQITLQLANQLIAKNVPIIMGTASAAGCGALLPIVANGPVVYCESPGLHPPPGSYAYSAISSSADTTAASVRYFRGRGFTRIAMITSTDASGQDGERGLDAALALPENKGITIVDREHFGPADISVAAQIARIKASGAQAVLSWSTGTPTGTLLRDFTGGGLEVPIVIGNGNSSAAQLREYAAFLPKELYVAGAPCLAPESVTDPGVKAALKTYFDTMKTLGITPDIIQATPWDSGLIVVDAFRKLGVKATAAQLRDYIDHLRGWAGIYGRYDFQAFPQRGLGPTSGSVIMTRWDPQSSTWIGVSKPGGAPK
jgi:branched-chain amino acid transport system substrate-binding protein